MDDFLLIVEDNVEELSSCLSLMKGLKYEVRGLSSFLEAETLLKKKKVDLLFVDLFLSSDPNPLGIELLKLAVKFNPSVLPIIMSSHPDAQLYLRAMEEGALYAIKKPLINQDELTIAITEARERRWLQNEKKEGSLPEQLLKLCPDGLVLSEKTRRATEILSRNPSLPAVIYGETGTGKEEVAKLIHKKRMVMGARIPFVAVNCSLLNGDLAESLLFGHVKGAFSGAVVDTEGFIGTARGGVLFLDEVHTLSLKCQQKLLRVLSDGHYHRVGEHKERQSQFQIIAASGINLDQAIDSGHFLLDLASRLTGIEIHLPPLRERKEELPLLVRLFLAKKQVFLDEKTLNKLIRLCESYYWQGNIRQLYQVLHATMALSHADGEELNPAYLPDLTSMKAPSAKRRKILQFLNFSSF
ncbi:MAG: sigma-54-dependent Fis family transcriptional regulator [Oligoflexales bacterium]|nr:sigma-54-dependent Fis family transcriptional regulator [Oligoflexales bacterium]